MVAMSEDAALLCRYAHKGDEAALAELVRRYLGLVYHAAQRQLETESHLAEDVTQKVFVLLARKAPRLTQHATLAGWLHTTTRNVARETQRGERRRRIHEQEAFIMQETTRDRPGAEAAWADLRPVIDEALGELDARDREVVLLRFFADLPHARIGERLALTENAARMRVERALDKLHERLARRGVTSTAAALGVVLANQAGAAAAAVPVGLAGSVTSAVLAVAAKSGGAGVAIGIMSMSKTVVTVGGALLLCGLLGTAVREHRRAAEAQVAAEFARKGTARLEARRAEVRRLAQVAERDAAEWKGKFAAAQAERAKAAMAPRPTSAVASRGPDPDWDPVAAGRGLMERHPELKRAVFARADATTNFTYGPMFRELGLTPAQEQAFRELMRERGGITAPSSGPRGEAYAFNTGTNLPMEAFEPRLRELLGEDGYALLGEFMRLNEARSAVAQVASAMAFSDTPVSSLQAQRLAGVMMDTARTPGSTRVGRLDWNEITARAPTVLSPPQMEALAVVRAENERQRASRISYPASTNVGGAKK